jgi:hypothetical protein
VVGAATVAKAEAFVHWLWAEYLVNNSNESTKKYIFFINTVWLINNIITPFARGFSGGEVRIFFNCGNISGENIKP